MKFGVIPDSNPPLRVSRNKGSASVLLPNKEALAQLTSGSPEQQAQSNYAKLTPSGRAALSTPNILDMGAKGVKVE